MPDLRQEIFTLLKDIIDGEWGPYDDDHYWPMVDEFMAKAGLTHEAAFRFIHKASGRSSILTDPGDVRVARKITESHNLVQVSRYITEWVDDA